MCIEQVDCGDPQTPETLVAAALAVLVAGIRDALAVDHAEEKLGCEEDVFGFGGVCGEPPADEFFAVAVE